MTWPVVQYGNTGARVGDPGAKVSAVQSQLVESGYAVTVDGVYGPGTDSAVRSFQGAQGLGADGVVGENTWNKFAW
nr:peptidoglycan-binding domain-containing protein [Massilia polaris]